MNRLRQLKGPKSQFTRNAIQIQSSKWHNNTKHIKKPKKKTQKNARMGSRMPNLKNTISQKLGFFLVKNGVRALTSGKALTPILNA